MRHTRFFLFGLLLSFVTILPVFSQVTVKVQSPSEVVEGDRFHIAYPRMALPFVTAGMMYTMNRDNFMVLFEDPMGQIAIGVSLVMMIIGFIVIRKIVDIDA